MSNSADIELLDPAIDEQEDQEQSAHDVVFWITKYAQHQETGKNYVKDIIINYLKLLKVFYFLGFRRLDIDDQHIFVQVINSRVVRRITITAVVDAFFDFLDEKEVWLDADYTLHINKLKEKFLKSPGSYFKEDKLYRLKPTEPIEFNKDSQDTKYLYYKNGFVRINKEGITFNDYSQLEHYIWESEILQRNWLAKPDLVSPFEKFAHCICSINKVLDEPRFNALKNITGYYLHSYYDCELQALVLTDSKISQDNEANGRTGKSLFCKALGYMLSSKPESAASKTYVDINGKDFDPTKTHKYQMVGHETKLICLNDVKRYFDVDCVYNDVTEGLMVEYKNMQPFKVWVKILLTTNKTIKIEGDSSKARFLQFEFSDYFSRSYTPMMEFKHRFFRDWDADHWAAFDWFMADCIHGYFKNNCRLEEPGHINLNARKLIETTHSDFIDFMTDMKIEFDTWYNKKDMFNNFCNRYEDFKNDSRFKQAKFSTWVKNYTKYHDDFAEYHKDRDEKRNDDLIEMCFRKAGYGTGKDDETIF